MRYRAILLLLTLGVGLAAAQPAKREPAAKSVGEPGSLLRREAAAKLWQLVGDKETLHTGDVLVAGGGASLEATNGAVRLVLQGGAGGTAPLPVLESAIVLNTSPNSDLDFTLLRGRVDLSNTKPKGEAKVRVRGPDGAAADLRLESGASVALVLSGRWPAGVPFRKDAKPEEHKPALAFLVLVLKGEIEVKTAKNQFPMQAPPGPALLEGDNIGATDPAPRRLEKLPDWAAEPAASDDAKKVQAALTRFRTLAQKQTVPEAIDQLLQAKDPVERRVGIALLGATDNLERLAQALTAAKEPDVWESSVGVLRHWIGREPGQDQKLFQLLQDKNKLTAAQAETVVQLLHNFGTDALAQPEAYETLIDLMGSDTLAIRGLAHWHLYRLVGPGRKIGYDPLAPADKRAAAILEWRKLIPAGKLPPTK